MNCLAKLYVAKFIRGLKMCGWFICGHCANVAKDIYFFKQERERLLMH